MASAEDVEHRQAERARATTTLEDGTTMSLVLQGPMATESLAKHALRSASADLVHRVAEQNRKIPTPYEGIVGESEPMQQLFRLLDRISKSNATALITGENGTGKELVARAIHARSLRADQRFVATNCSAFNDNLLESELFGHKRGAFTDAVADKPGLFQVADKGSFFLDEVGDMSPALQVKLLRVLQEGVIVPVGSTDPCKVDVRIIAATNRDLKAMMASGEFREDLYYRLHVVALRVPPLRDRPEDTPYLIDHFLGRLAQRERKEKVLARETQRRLLEHSWPGNVRELENEIERLWVLSGDERVIGEEHMSAAVAGIRSTIAPVAAGEADSAAIAPSTTLPEAVESLERRLILEGLRRAKGNKTRTAEQLGISRRNLIRKVQAYGLEAVAAGKGSRIGEKADQEDEALP